MAAKKPEKKAEKKAEKKPVTTTPAGQSSLWTLPLAMVMLAIAAGGLWFAMRESSNRTEAATATAVMAPDGESKASKAEPRASAPAAATAPAAPAKSETAGSAAVKPVSVTGCLQKNDHGFLLKDTEGADAPKSRSWKSGFLKRSSSSIALSDAANAHLADHVGQRVSVTGPLVDRQMRVTSMRRVSASCE